MKKILLLFDSPYSKPRGYDFKEEFELKDWQTERNIYEALLQNGYKVRLLGIYNNLKLLLEEVEEHKPDMVFNLTDVFEQKTHLDKNIPAVLELLNLPYTGASPASLLICNDKALSKKILSFHRIKVPNFKAFYQYRKVKLPKRLKLPLIVKPLCEEASRGISQASFVDGESAFLERVKFIHEKMQLDAIAEEYIEGRELYMGVLGNRRVKVFHPVEMKFGKISEDEPRIATYKAKWDDAYRKKWGLKNVAIGPLPQEIDKKIQKICKRAYRVLNMQGYARFDIRLTPDNQVYILEPNANPCLAKDDDFAKAAEKDGIAYDKLVCKIINIALQRR